MRPGSFLRSERAREYGALAARIGVLIGSRFGGSVLTLLYTLLIARIATPADFGLAMLGLSWALLGSIPLSLNVESGSVKYLVAYARSGEPGKSSGFLRFNLLLLCASAGLVVAGAGLALAAGWIDAGTVGGRVALLAALTAPVEAMARVYGRHATALDQVLRGSLPRMLVRPAFFCLVLGGVWLAGLRIGADTVMGLFLLAALLTTGLQTWLLRRTFGFARQAAPDMSERATWMRTGLMLAPLLLMRENLKNVIVATAGVVLAKPEVGLLALSLSVLSIVIFAVKAVDIAVSPRLSKAIQHDRPRQVRSYLGASAAVKLVGTVLGLAAIAVLGDRVLGAFGAEFTAAHGAVLILFAIPAADAVFGPTDMVLNVTGNRASILAVSVGSFAALVAGTAIGGTLGGLEGAAWGAAIPYALQQLVLCLQCHRQAGIDPSLLGVLALVRDRRG